MGVDTKGRIKGFIKADDIIKYLQKNYDKNAYGKIERTVYESIYSLNSKYELNQGSEDDYHWYIDSGFIYFNDGDEDRQLYYHYSNINFFENLDYYKELNLEEMVCSETTFLSLGCFGNSKEIIQNIITNFGSGWIDENDCDEIPYQYIKSSTELKIGGIYRWIDGAIFNESHFIFLDILDDNDYKCVDIDVEENSNKAVQLQVAYRLNNHLFDKNDFWTVCSKEDLINNSDGYLGQISMPLLRGLKEVSNKY